jgi:hypothetical protein
LLLSRFGYRISFFSGFGSLFNGLFGLCSFRGSVSSRFG